MLKSCAVCGKIHEMEKICKWTRVKRKTTSNSFRRTNQWKQKSESIRRRDKCLCRVCISGKYKTLYMYNYKELEVHHIIPISENKELKLEDDNLITLCRYHHKMAELGQIPREELKKLITRK